MCVCDIKKEIQKKKKKKILINDTMMMKNFNDNNH